VHTGVGSRLQVVLGTLGGLSALLLAGCSRPVAVPATTPSSDSVKTICAALTADLPAQVTGQNRREIDSGTPDVAAWGTPALTLRCGVERPPGLIPSASLITINGLDWFAETHTTGFVFTTVGRQANVEVAVPSRYQPETSALIDLGSAITSHDPAAKP